MVRSSDERSRKFYRDRAPSFFFFGKSRSRPPRIFDQSFTKIPPYERKLWLYWRTRHEVPRRKFIGPKEGARSGRRERRGQRHTEALSFSIPPLFSPIIRWFFCSLFLHPLAFSVGLVVNLLFRHPKSTLLALQMLFSKISRNPPPTGDLVYCFTVGARKARIHFVVNCPLIHSSIVRYYQILGFIMSRVDCLTTANCSQRPIIFESNHTYIRKNTLLMN